MLMRSGYVWLALIVPLAGVLPAVADNLALKGTARSWLESSVPTVPASLANDGDPLSWWGSNEPTTDPPKDIGIEWQTPVDFSSVRVLFFSFGYTPTPAGWHLEALIDDEWSALPAVVDNTDCERWTFRFPPCRAHGVRLVVTEYRRNRPAVSEFEVYAHEPPARALRRAALLGGAFWAFQYPHWADHWDDEALMREVDHAYAIGLKTLMLYTLNGRDGDFSTVAPDMPIRQTEQWRGRDPLKIILSRADLLGMQVYLGDAQPTGFMGPHEDAGAVATAAGMLESYRQELLARYGEHPSLVGYYLNFETMPHRFNNDPVEPARQMQQLASFIRGIRPELSIVMPLGLYRWRNEPDGQWDFISREQLIGYWKPFIAAVPDADVVMIIDGIGTGLSTMAHTDMAHGAIRQICDELGKGFWSDVECAVMGSAWGYESYPIGRLVTAIEIAAAHADHLVTFDYPNYLSPTNGREPSAKLYEDYREYRNTVLGRW